MKLISFILDSVYVSHAETEIISLEFSIRYMKQQEHKRNFPEKCNCENRFKTFQSRQEKNFSKSKEQAIEEKGCSQV